MLSFIVTKDFAFALHSVQSQYAPGKVSYTEVNMEKFVIILIPAILVILFLRLLAVPMRFLFRLGIHAAFGFVCLWLLNAISGFTGVLFPINLITVLVAGSLGAPGIGVLAVLALMSIG